MVSIRGRIIASLRHLGIGVGLLLPTALLIGGCAAIARLPGNPSLTGDIEPAVLEDLSHGRLLPVRDRYEQLGYARLNDGQLAILCDIYVRHVSIDQARNCLNELLHRGSANRQRVQEKQALVEFLTGNYGSAKDLSTRSVSYGGRYVHALSLAQLGDVEAARQTAWRWVQASDPVPVYLGSNLYLAIGDYAEARTALESPFTRLAWDYTLKPTRGAFAVTIPTAPLRVDLFDEFGYGVLGRWSYAPADNLGVALARAKAELGLAETGNGSYADARALLQQIENHPALRAHSHYQWQVDYMLGRIAEHEGRTADAEARFRQSIDTIEQTRTAISLASARGGFMDDKHEVYAALVGLLIDDKQDVASAFAYAERSTARAMLDLLASQRHFGTMLMADDEVTRLFDDLEHSDIESSEGIAAGETVGDTRGYIDERERILKRIYADDAKALAAVAAKQEPLSRIQSALQPDETLLRYFKDDQGWLVFIVKRNSPIKQVRLQRDGLDQLIGAARREFADRSSSEVAYRQTAKRLYQVLIAPIEPDLTGKLTIVPYGRLSYVPFAALIAPDDRYLIETSVIAQLPTSNLRPYFPRSRGSGPALFVGNPTADLPAAEEEASTLQKRYKDGDAVPLLGKQATEPAFLREAPGKTLLHVASHAVFDAENPERSRINLAPSGPDADGQLTAKELFEADARWKGLTFLNGCETGVGAARPGRETVGLRSAILVRGASAIVDTQWKISAGGASVYLPEIFYAEFARGQSAPEALRKAQIATMEHPSYAHPYHWAAYTVTGAQH